MSGQVPLALHSAAEHQMNRSLLVCSGGYWLFQKMCQEVWSHRSNVLDIFPQSIVPLSLSLSLSLSCNFLQVTRVSHDVNYTKRHISSRQTAKNFLPKYF